MIFRAHIPSAPLDRFVGRIIYYEGYEPPHRLDRFLPDGNTEIVFNLTESPQDIFDNDTLKSMRSYRDVWVSGVRTRPITIPSGRGCRMVVIIAKRGRASRWYPLPLDELRDMVVPGELVFGREILELRNRFVEAGSVDRIIRLAESFLMRLLREESCPGPESSCIEYSVSSIVSDTGCLNLKQLSERIGYSQKHFIDLFKRHVGVSPKRYLRIMRFQKAILQIETGETLPWDQVAAEAGYYDQSHFIHDFKSFSGFTPGEYLRMKSSTLNYVPVG
jgi:AraC-like DNA-binding protein